MSEQENFLARWSRKKLETTEAPAAPKSVDEAAAVQSRRADQSGEDHPAKPGQTASKETFDVASLPSIDSISSATDVRAFLAPGVPPELTRAALRRAWSADPAIRDFVGLQEYDWDFANPVGVPGFGDLPPGTDIKKLVADVFGNADRPADEIDEAGAQGQPAAQSQPAGPSSQLQVEGPACDNEAIKVADRSHAPPPPPVQEPGAEAEGRQGKDEATPTTEVDTPIVQRNNTTATQQSIRRQYGRALPK
jgi:hypothetical protein